MLNLSRYVSQPYPPTLSTLHDCVNSGCYLHIVDALAKDVCAHVECCLFHVIVFVDELVCGLGGEASHLVA